MSQLPSHRIGTRGRASFDGIEEHVNKLGASKSPVPWFWLFLLSRC
jgi:hypothetical protein